MLNGERINRTLRAIIKGLKLLDSQVISGVVLSNVAPRQAEKLVKSLPDEGIEVLWIMPMSKAVADAFSYRHLGLAPVGER